MFKNFKIEFKEFVILLQSVPSLTVVLFVMSLFSMNLLANKSINLPFSWLALDCGIIASWFAFLAMDIITKHFGPKAATQISVSAILLNLLFCLLFYFGSIIPGSWGESYIPGSEDAINNALNNTFGGTWYIVLGSTTAFIISAAVNNFTNHAIGKLFIKNPDGIIAYAARSYISTAIGQFTDNFVFALLVSRLFFGWSLLQCITCSLTGMVAELLFEAVFSPFGYKTCQRWKSQKIGAEYFNFIQNRKTKEASL